MSIHFLQGKLQGDHSTGCATRCIPWNEHVLLSLSFARGSVEPVVATPVSEDQQSPLCISSQQRQ
jgi:hypothetical protein